MPYTYNCDGPCGRSFNSRPPFMGEFRESFLKTTPSLIAQMYKPGDTLTVCRDCAELLFQSGAIIVCRRCGWAKNADDLPGGIDVCPACEEDSLTHTEVDP